MIQENERLNADLQIERLREADVVTESRKAIDDQERYLGGLAKDLDHYKDQYHQTYNEVSNLKKDQISDSAKLQALHKELSQTHLADLQGKRASLREKIAQPDFDHKNSESKENVRLRQENLNQ